MCHSSTMIDNFRDMWNRREMPQEIEMVTYDGPKMWGDAAHVLVLIGANYDKLLSQTAGTTHCTQPYHKVRTQRYKLMCLFVYQSFPSHSHIINGPKSQWNLLLGVFYTTIPTFYFSYINLFKVLNPILRWSIFRINRASTHIFYSVDLYLIIRRRRRIFI